MNGPNQSNAPATEPLKVGEEVEIHGQAMMVKSVDGETGQPQLVPTPTKPLTKEEQREKYWNGVVSGIIRKSKKLAENAPIQMPAASSGRYIKFALDKNGNFSLGKGRGRLRQRVNPTMLSIARLSQQYFGIYLQSLFKAAQAEAKNETASIKPITQEDLNKAQAWALNRAETEISAPRKAARKPARARQKAARRQGFGLISGNQARCTFSGR